MYYRHLHGLRQSDIITLEHRRESWRNYVRLFEIFQTQTTKMSLPTMWLWDMIDEFLYQFGLYTSIKGLVSERTTSEIEFLKANQDVWDPAKVLHRSLSFDIYILTNLRLAPFTMIDPHFHNVAIPLGQV